MRPAARLALAKRLDKIAPGRDGRIMRDGQLSRDAQALLDAVNITLAMHSTPADKYAYSLTNEGAALAAQLFQATTPAESVDVIIPTDEPIIAQAKYRDWAG
ncbi:MULTISPECIES: hypothetical protein [unclassified Mesorhizobium]|uniref:hypothetical protein n=1 Tax=unclassified Mesorhizobium TaxID=325217 RepID=UPI000FCB11FF|nr:MULTISPECIES: hypothetical protein [unclassified Mesorhizobium]RVC41673.1 hypothetical protein EN781_25250 [Mesorhizobium sp. M4A.F.Ca.ET.090.04.2.1]RWC95639.1 MAG: hypothetical protein EOS32_11945 [Mesorhizobium sp.]TGV25984.1 hypothetical protein EN786_10540 [Mesorhizobium sp. M4B.F.Ca.ET.143.01.1.1]